MSKHYRRWTPKITWKLDHESTLRRYTWRQWKEIQASREYQRWAWRIVDERGGKCENPCCCTQHLKKVVHHLFYYGVRREDGSGLDHSRHPQEYADDELQVLCINCHDRAHFNVSVAKHQKLPPNVVAFPGSGIAIQLTFDEALDQGLDSSAG